MLMSDDDKIDDRYWCCYLDSPLVRLDHVASFDVVTWNGLEYDRAIWTFDVYLSEVSVTRCQLRGNQKR